MHQLDALREEAVALCKKKKWSRDWSNGGCVLHLEVSEYIEALRGKEGHPVIEAGDILFVLLSMMGEYNIPTEDVLSLARAKVEYRGRDGWDKKEEKAYLRGILKEMGYN